MAASFSRIKNSVTAYCLMFDTAENKSSILNQVKYKSLHLPSHILWQIEAEETMNKLGQILLQGHIAHARHLQRHYFPNAPHN